jgi:RNA-directed DNA polymerase
MRSEPPTIKTPFQPPIRTIDDIARLVENDPAFIESLVDQAPVLYSFFRQPKKGGGFREIRPPKQNLRTIQRVLYQSFDTRVRYPRWMTGGVPRRSIFVHARRHVGRRMVGTLDVAKFFPSINALHVRKVFERFAVSGVALDALVRLTTIHDQLPQGSPASCFLANLMFDPIDRQIDALCRKYKLFYTRYIDDMAISGDVDVRPFQGAIINIIRRHGLDVAADKIFWMDQSVTQKITGLCVNEKLRPLKEFIDDVEESLWECLTGGGPHRFALEHGLTIGRLKSKLTGRVQHIKRADPVLGRKLKGKLYQIQWRRASQRSRNPSLRGLPSDKTPPDATLADTRELPVRPSEQSGTVAPPW